MNNDILIKAAEALEKAASDITSSRNREDDLLLENQKLKLMISAMMRAGQAKKLAVEMAKKGIIPQKDITSKAKDIMNLDDTAYEMLVSTVLGAPSDITLLESPFEVVNADKKTPKDLLHEDVLKDKTIQAILNA